MKETAYTRLHDTLVELLVQGGVPIDLAESSTTVLSQRLASASDRVVLACVDDPEKLREAVEADIAETMRHWYAALQTIVRDLTGKELVFPLGELLKLH